MLVASTDEPIAGLYPHCCYLIPPWCAKLQRYFDHLRGQPWLNPFGQPTQPRCLTSSYWIPPDMTSIASAFSGGPWTWSNKWSQMYIQQLHTSTSFGMERSSADPWGSWLLWLKTWVQVCNNETERCHFECWNRPFLECSFLRKSHLLDQEGLSRFPTNMVTYRNIFHGPAFSQWMVTSQIQQLSCSICEYESRVSHR